MADSRADSFLEQACSTYRKLATLPTPSKGRIINSRASAEVTEVEVQWTQRDLDRGKNLVFTRRSILSQSGDAGLQKISSGTFQKDVTQIIKESYSDGNGVYAVLRKDKKASAGAHEEPQQFIEVWGECGLVKSLSVVDMKKSHGKIHEDIHFGSFQLCSDGSKLLYIAEKKRPEAVSYFKKSPDPPEGGDKPVQGEEFAYEESWGEQLTSVVDPVVIVLDIASGKSSAVPVPSGKSCCYAQWLPGSSSELVFAGYDNEPLKLGFVYCLNRKSCLYHVNIEQDSCVELVQGEVCIFSPRFNPQGTKLIYLECVTGPGQPHRSCARMRMVDWATKSVSTVIDVMDNPKAGDFCGIYSPALPQRCWDEKGEKVYFNDLCRSLVDIVCVDTVAKTVRYVTNGFGAELGTFVVLDVSEGKIIASFATPCSHHRVLLGSLPAGASTLEWTELDSMRCSNDVDNSTWELLQIERNGGNYEAILVKPSSSTPPPLVVVNHGGPHGSVPADRSVWIACLVSLGYAVVCVNYRGSIGFGQEFVNSLPGHVGTLDVNDIQHVVKSLVDKGTVDGSRVVVTGGSHGGFLTVHLIGQFPDFYKAAYVRNPVTDINAQMYITDIPDWSCCESGVLYDPAQPPTRERITKMLSVSPIQYVDKIKTPILIATGGEDRRVPPSQGKQLYHMLKARGKKTRLFWYPKDSHPLSSVDTDADCFMHAVMWFNQHIN